MPRVIGVLYQLESSFISISFPFASLYMLQYCIVFHQQQKLCVSGKTFCSSQSKQVDGPSSNTSILPRQVDLSFNILDESTIFILTDFSIFLHIQSFLKNALKFPCLIPLIVFKAFDFFGRLQQQLASVQVSVPDEFVKALLRLIHLHLGFPSCLFFQLS